MNFNSTVEIWPNKLGLLCWIHSQLYLPSPAKLSKRAKSSSKVSLLSGSKLPAVRCTEGCLHVSKQETEHVSLAKGHTNRESCYVENQDQRQARRSLREHNSLRWQAMTWVCVFVNTNCVTPGLVTRVSPCPFPAQPGPLSPHHRGRPD